jgi:hypothetical protein
VVELKYLDQNRRASDRPTSWAPIRPEDVEFLMDADSFVCVPITDYQVSQDTSSAATNGSRSKKANFE